jgi:hypothetical protein
VEELEVLVLYVLGSVLGDAPIREEPLHVSGTCPVETKLNFGLYQCGKDSGLQVYLKAEK